MIQDNYSLTEAQIQHFEVFGFLVRRNVFSAEEVARMNEEFDRRLATVLEETDLEEKRFLHWTNLTEETPFIASLVNDPRIYLHSEQLIGEDSVFHNSGSNSFPKGDTEWHPDRADLNVCSIRSAMYLQPTTADCGALRVIPGSHKNPLHEDLHSIGLWVPEDKAPYLEKSGLSGEDIPCYVFESEPGDMITWNEQTWHAAFGGYKDRRTCNFDFFGNPKTPDEIASMRSLAKQGKRYQPWWLGNPDNIPRRERWINWLQEWGWIKD